MQAFEALSLGDKWRVSRSVFRGEAPADARMAAAAVDLAERYQRQRYSRVLRWFVPVVTACTIVVAILGAVAGELLVVVVFGLAALVNIGHLALNPAVRPARVARSLAASRQLVAEGH